MPQGLVFTKLLRNMANRYGDNRVSVNNYVLSHCLDVLQYVPAAICFSAGIIVVILIASIFIRALRKELQVGKLCTIFGMGVYLICVLQITIFSRESGSLNKGVDFSLFSRMDSAIERAFFIENIVMFIPLGLFMPMLFKGFRHILSFTVLAGCLSVLLESVQLITGRGYCQMEDVLTNTLGAIIGFVGYLYLRDIQILFFKLFRKEYIPDS